MREDVSFQDRLEKANKCVYRLLAHRGRSCKEVSDRLIQKGFSREVIEQTIKKFGDLNYLNDREFASNWADMKLVVRPCGRRLIETELKRKGVDEQIIQDVIEKAYLGKDEAGMARNLARDKLKKWVSVDRKKAKNRIYRLLLRRGFSAEVVNEVIQEGVQE